MTPLPAWARALTDRRFLYALAWLIALGIGTGRVINALQSWENKSRIDDNGGHVTIDFGGQWMMGRLLATGNGKELFVRPRQWEVAQRSYPVRFEDPNQEEHDPRNLVGSFMGKDDERWLNPAGAWTALIAPSGPFQQAAVALQVHDEWDPALVKELNHPTKGDGIGGPLYPPIHAFVMLPFATDDHPQAAYTVMHYVQTFWCFVGGFAISIVSRGRLWAPIAASILLIYPGCRGAVDLGQNSPMTVAILCCGWAAMSRDRMILGGMIWGLLAYKPVWALSFGLMLLLMQHWRAAFAMAATGAGLALATLPYVGLHTWIHWLETGKSAADLYNVDGNWVPLSRDLLGLPRRIMLDFTAPRSTRDRPLITLACWAVWAFVLEVTLRTYAMRGRGPMPFVGPLPAMLALTAWACTFHFMYYDAMISAFGLLILMADPRPFFHRQVWTTPEPDEGPRSHLVTNSFVLTVVAMLLFYEVLLQPGTWEGTISPQEYTKARTFHDGSTAPSPQFNFGAGYRYPTDTFVILLLWFWCVAAVCREPGQMTPRSELSA